MFQEIAPHVFHNEYKNAQPRPQDLVVCYKDEQITVKNIDTDPCMPTVREFDGAEMQYLFSMDDVNVFGILNCEKLPRGVEYCSIRKALYIGKPDVTYTRMCALHLLRWYADNKVCGRCGTKLVHSKTERSLICPDCGKTLYPSLYPAVIVAVLNGNKVLLTQYAHRARKHYALIAGFGEFGETIEETCHREVMEEVGLKIKNLRYYKSQPWALSSSLLFGFYCELDGDDTIILDENELGEAVWTDVDRLSGDYSTMNGSLTSEMIFNAKNFVKR